MKLCFRWVGEPRPGERWRQLFERTWPSYQRWFLLEGEEARPDLTTARKRLEEHMPELVELWEQLVDLSGGGEQVARMLGLWGPAPYLAGCSQAVWVRGRPFLVRNYDYQPASCEGTFLLTSWLDTRVLVSSDCLWGALDGINEHGLAVALAFGGDPAVGEGFGIPLILRYVLQVCATVEEASEILRRVPSHMAYNVSVLDASGAHAVAYLSPERKTRIEPHAVATNHQGAVEWTEYGRVTRSAERAEFLERKLESVGRPGAFVDLFLRPPLYVGDHGRGYGTLYTSVYRPGSRGAEFLWPHCRVRQSLDDFTETELVVRY